MSGPSARKHPRLREWDYSGNGAYFVTVCVQNRQSLLSTVVGRGALTRWQYIDDNPAKWDEDEYFI